MVTCCEATFYNFSIRNVCLFITFRLTTHYNACDFLFAVLSPDSVHVSVCQNLKEQIFLAFFFTVLTLLVGDRKGIWPVKT